MVLMSSRTLEQLNQFITSHTFHLNLQLSGQNYIIVQECTSCHVAIANVVNDISASHGPQARISIKHIITPM